MARHRFGGTLAAYVVAAGDASGSGFLTLLVPGTAVTFWNLQTGGTQYTDLEDLAGAAITSVTADGEGGIPEFNGPDGVVLMYADAGGTRKRIVTSDLFGEVLQLRSDHDALASSIISAPVFVYRNADGSWPSRPPTGAPVEWTDNDPVNPQPPVIGAGGMTDGLDYYRGRV